MDFMNQFNDANAQATFTAEEVKKNQIFCVLAYLGILFFVPFVADKNSAYAKFHANQGFAFFLANIAISVIRVILAFIPVLGAVVGWLLSVVFFVAMILLMVCAYKGMAVRIPVIGTLEIFK
jgi:uncharacterized membrane protein